MRAAAKVGETLTILTLMSIIIIIPKLKYIDTSVNRPIISPGFQDFLKKLKQKSYRMTVADPRLSANMLALASNIGCLNINFSTKTRCFLIMKRFC